MPPETITDAVVPVRGEPVRATLVRVAPGGRHAWRAEAPGEDHDMWLYDDDEVTPRQ